MTLLRTLLFAAGAGLSLSACAATTAEPAPPAAIHSPPSAPAEETPMTCDASKGQWAIGQIADDALVAKVKADTGSDRYRVIPPDTAVTMDYREDRVNIDVDDGNIVTAVRCG